MVTILNIDFYVLGNNIYNFLNDITLGLDFYQFILRCFIAVFCGFLIGLERQLKGHGIGFKTTILLSLGACIFVLFGYSDEAKEGARMAAAVVTGIGFLCSGTIFRGGMSIKGVNTSTTIWISGGIGCLAGVGNFGGCLFATLIVIGTNLFTYKIAKLFPGEGGEGTVKAEHALLFEIPYDKEQIVDLRNLVMEYADKGYVITELSEKKNVLKAELTFIGIPNAKKAEELALVFSKFSNGQGISWKLTK